jgi:hypothetical protein
MWCPPSSDFHEQCFEVRLVAKHFPKYGEVRHLFVASQRDSMNRRSPSKHVVPAITAELEQASFVHDRGAGRSVGADPAENRPARTPAEARSGGGNGLVVVCGGVFMSSSAGALSRFAR